MTRVIVSLAVAAAVALAPSPARACSPVPPRWPDLAEPSFEDARIEIASERLSLACSAQGRDAACTLEIALRIRNTAPSRVETVGAILTGRPVAAVESSVALRELPSTRAALERFLTGIPEHDDRWQLLHRAFVLDVGLDAGEARDLVFRTSFVMERFVDPCFVEGVEARHAIFAAGHRQGSFQLRYFRGEAGREHRRRSMDVRVRRPIAWEGNIGSARSYAAGAEAPAPVVVHHAEQEDHASVDWAGVDSAVITLSVPRSKVWGGGPFVGAGVAFGPASERGPRLRVGYELAAPVWLLHSIAAETDARRMFAIVPASEIVTRSGAMAPIVLGAGAGLPVRIRPEARVGGRLQASVSYRFVTLHGALDVFPKTGSLPTVVAGLLGGQLSL